MSKNAFLNLTILLLFSFQSISQNYVAGLVACYPFDGNANDMSGNNHNGVIHGNPTLTADRSGNPNSAYLFNGSTDYIAIGMHQAFFPTSDNVSVSVWIKANSLMPQTILMAYPDLFADRFNFMAYYSNNGIPLTILDHGNCQNGGRLTHQMPAFSNLWEHYVFVVDNTQSTMAIYLNGTLLDSQNFALPLVNKSRTLNIGWGEDQAGAPFYFDGIIDDLRIYDRPLTAVEAQGLYSLYLSCIATAIPEYSKGSIKIVREMNGDIIFSSDVILNQAILSIYGSKGDLLISDLPFQDGFLKVNDSKLPEAIYLAVINSKTIHQAVKFNVTKR